MIYEEIKKRIGAAPDMERILTAIALVVVVVSTLVDVYEDRLEGSSVLSLAGDLLVSGFVAATLLYIWKQRPRATQEFNRYLQNMVRESNQDMLLWKARAAKLLRGLGAEINQQFELWHLSKAEKEVALLLIKGFSLKQLAGMRGTSEKTVRQQASNIYAKANLDNRAELSAFFLEDLLLP